MPSAKTMDLELLLVPEARLVFTVKSFNGAGGVVLGLGGHAQKKKTGCHGETVEWTRKRMKNL
jgi:hypothetical protein